MIILQDVDDRVKALERRVNTLERRLASEKVEPSESLPCSRCGILKKDLRAANEEVGRLRDQLIALEKRK